MTMVALERERAARFFEAFPGARAAPLPQFLDLALLAALLALGFWLRQRMLMEVPPFTDETEEVRHALQIARGETLPLDNVNGFISAWNSYLTAGAFLVFGTSMQVARGVTMVLGTLTIGLTYGLGRVVWGSRLAGLLAAALLACSGAHVVVGSRVAWSNCTSAFFTTLATLLLASSLRRKDGRLLVGAGATGGLAILSHPATLPVVVGLGGVVLWQAWKHRWPRPVLLAGALAVFLLVCSPIVGQNVLNGFPAIADGEKRIDNYGDGATLTPKIYARNLELLLTGTGQMVASSFYPEVTSLADPAAQVGLFVALAGLAFAVWKRQWVLVIPVLLTMLVLPTMNPKYNLVTNGRYLMPLLPLIAVALAGAIALLVQLARSPSGGPTSRIHPWLQRAVLGGTAAALTLWLLVTPVQRLMTYEDRVVQEGQNSALLYTAARIEAVRQGDEYVLLDRRLKISGSSNPVAVERRASILRVLLELGGVHSSVADTSDRSETTDALRSANGDTALVVQLVKSAPPSALAEPVATDLLTLEPNEMRVRVLRLPRLGT